MFFSELKNLNKDQKRQVMDLWNNEYPSKVIHSSVTEFEHYLQDLVDQHHIILSDDNGNVKGWLVYFIRNSERWFAMILDASIQRKGWGSKFLDLAKEYNSELNGWIIDNDNELKQNGEPYKSPVEFYKKNGFQILFKTTFTFDDLTGIKIAWKK